MYELKVAVTAASDQSVYVALKHLIALLELFVRSVQISLFRVDTNIYHFSGVTRRTHECLTYTLEKLHRLSDDWQREKVSQRFQRLKGIQRFKIYFCVHFT